ncbi:MAG: sigma-70 family RNA polymerase sigma factor [Ferruginibacter sp.]
MTCLIKQVDNKIANTQAERHLVEKVINGDNHAFGTIIKNTQGLVGQIVFKLVPNSEDRKDIVQDIYLKAFHKLPGFKLQSKLSTWIGQIAWNTCINWLEKKKLVFPPVDDKTRETMGEPLELLSNRSADVFDKEAEKDIFRKERAEILQSAIETLPPMYKTLVVLYHAEELSYEELCQVTGLPEGTVKSYLFRARKMLKDHLLTNYKKEEL